MKPVLHDAVTLRHFAAVSRIDILEARHGQRPPPLWAEAVHEEIRSGVEAGNAYCSDVLEASWLGNPAPVQEADLEPIFSLQVGINQGIYPPDMKRNRGEAESIYFAERHDGQFATDDNAAYKFACRRPSLGPGRVIDSIDILRTAVALGEITATDAFTVAENIEAEGRFFRPEHRIRREPSYFT